MQRELNKIKEYWDSKAGVDPVEASGWIIRGERFSDKVIDAVCRDIKEKLELASTDSLLDAGCGSMIFLNRLNRFVASSIGVDLSYSTLKRFRSDNSVVCAELNSIPFRDGRFTKVLCNSVLVSLPDIDYMREAILELIRVCAPGGIILLSDVLNDMLRKEQRLDRYNIANLFYYLKNPVLFFKSFFLPCDSHAPLSVDPLFIKKMVEDRGHRCKLLLHVIEGKPGCKWRYDVLIRKKK